MFKFGHVEIAGFNLGAEQVMRPVYIGLCSVFILAGCAVSPPSQPELTKADIYRDTILKLWQRAAERGDPISQQALGWELFQGKGRHQNRAEGIEWLEKSSNQGDVNSQYLLGVAYYAMGEEDKNNYRKAYYWWLIVARGRSESLIDKLKDAQQLLTSGEIDGAKKLAAEWNPSCEQGGANSEP